MMSLIEALANVLVGYAVAVLTQMLVFPWFGLSARVGDALAIGGIFTLISIARGYALRRLFETLRSRGLMAPSRERPAATRAVCPRE
ncbi:MAG: DUF7220 family protein [Pseudomonadota bacterium]